MPTLVRPVRMGFWPVRKDGAAGGAALLGVEVGEAHALIGDPIDVGGAIAHLARRLLAAHVPPADVIAPDTRMFGLSFGMSSESP